MKVHVALNTPRFDESVRFYRSFLGLEPVKLKPGYAKFDVAEPGLNLALNASSDTGPGALNHLGIQVQSTAAVREAAERLKAEGLATFEEENTNCCYALQDKVWVTDPNGAAGHGPAFARRGARPLGGGRGRAGEICRQPHGISLG